MSDLENMPEETNDFVQPTDAVAADVEVTEATPQAEDTEQEEFVIDGEGDQEEKPKDDEVKKRQAAFAERKRKQREAEEKARQERERAERLEKELAELRSKVGTMERGPRPNPDDFYGDPDGFYEALKKWEGGDKRQEKVEQQQAAPSYEPDYQAEFALEEGSEKLKTGGITDFDDKVSAVKESISQIAPGSDPEAIFNGLMSIAVNGGVDPAKAAYMIGLKPAEILAEMNSVNAPTEAARAFKLKAIMEREAKKLKTRKKNSVDTQPEPSVRSGAIKKSDPLSAYGSFE